MKHNFHTHTPLCGHAIGSPEDYARAAIEGGFDVLGFADHAPWPFANGHVSGMRMSLADFAAYRQAVWAARDRFAGQLDIRLGLEAEYFPRYLDAMHRLRDEGCAYFILGQHFMDSEEDHPSIPHQCSTDDGLMRYAESVARGIATGLYAYVAHPDVYMSARPAFDTACMNAADLICQAAKEYGVPLEYNLNGLHDELMQRSRNYPHADFWAYARKWDCPAIIGVDAHAPTMLTDTHLWDTAVARLNALNYRITDTI